MFFVSLVFLRKSIARNFVETVNLIAVKQESEKILEAKKSFLLYVSYILRTNDYDASTFVGNISYRCDMHMKLCCWRTPIKTIFWHRSMYS